MLEIPCESLTSSGNSRLDGALWNLQHLGSFHLGVAKHIHENNSPLLVFRKTRQCFGYVKTDIHLLREGLRSVLQHRCILVVRNRLMHRDLLLLSPLRESRIHRDSVEPRRKSSISLE